MALFSLRLLVYAALLAAVTPSTRAHASPLAIDVPLAPDGSVFVENDDAASDVHGPPGWKMTDRFAGFRFVLRLAPSLALSTDAFMEATASLARESRCFGWIQASATPDSVVGEVRCPRRVSASLESHLQSHGELTLRRYANSKIRYHFARFRVLSEPRYVGKTCFATPPHACEPSTKEHE